MSDILVIDDDPILRHALARILESEGYQVREAHDGLSAIRAAKERLPDLMLLDYMMPGMNGDMVLDIMRRELRDSTPPAVLLTASGHVQAKAERMGAACGLEKPFNVPELLSVVRRYLESTKASAE